MKKLAYFKRYRQRYRSYRSTGRGRFRSAYRSGGGSLIFGLGGVAAGYFAPRIHPAQDMAMTLIATLPAILPRGMRIPWQLSRFAGGYTVGTIARSAIPMGMNAIGMGGSDGSNVV